jgi:hypothetical protein
MRRDEKEKLATQLFPLFCLLEEEEEKTSSTIM